MTEPLSWSTLDEAAAWLTAKTADDWTARRVLDVVTLQAMQDVDRSHRMAAAHGVPARNRTPPNPFTVLQAAPPASVKFIQHPIPLAHPPGAVHFGGPLPWRLVPLRLADARQLLASGSLLLEYAGDRSNEVSAAGVRMYVEELSPAWTATLADIRLKAADLLALAAAAPQGTKGTAPAPAPAPLAAPAAELVPDVVAAAVPASDDAWKEQARAAALAIVKREAAFDRFPPQSRIADEVAADLRKRGTFGADGKPLSGATIKRHALKGISSATKKAKSTTIKRGK